MYIFAILQLCFRVWEKVRVDFGVKRSDEVGVEFLFDEAHGFAFGSLGCPHLRSGNGTIKQIDGWDRSIENTCGDCLNEWETLAQNSNISNELVTSKFGSASRFQKGVFALICVRKAYYAQ